MKSPLRWLDGVAYWVIEDHEAICQFVDKQLRKEWEEDLRSEGRDSKQSGWLESLLRRHWELKVLELSSVKLNPEIMNYANAERDHNFWEHLSKRATELRNSIEEFGVVIWPLVIRAEDSQLMDGYCRPIGDGHTESVRLLGKITVALVCGITKNPGVS